MAAAGKTNLGFLRGAETHRPCALRMRVMGHFPVEGSGDTALVGLRHSSSSALTQVPQKQMDFACTKRPHTPAFWTTAKAGGDDMACSSLPVAAGMRMVMAGGYEGRRGDNVGVMEGPTHSPGGRAQLHSVQQQGGIAESGRLIGRHRTRLPAAHAMNRQCSPRPQAKAGSGTMASSTALAAGFPVAMTASIPSTRIQPDRFKTWSRSIKYTPLGAQLTRHLCRGAER